MLSRRTLKISLLEMQEVCCFKKHNNVVVPIKGIIISVFLLSFFPGGSGKHRSKEQKKKNKQRLRFRAQNQHSDHLASARTSQ